MAVIEAMSHGVPVVCTPVGGLPEIITHEQSGLFCEPGNIPQLTQPIARVLADPSLAARLGAAGHEAIRGHATTESTSAALEPLYAEVTGKDAAFAAV